MEDLTGLTLQDLIDQLERYVAAAVDPRIDTPKKHATGTEPTGYNRPIPLLFISQGGKGRGAGC